MNKKPKTQNHPPKIDTNVWNFDQIRHAKRVHKIGINRQNSCQEVVAPPRHNLIPCLAKLVPFLFVHFVFLIFVSSLFKFVFAFFEVKFN